MSITKNVELRGTLHMVLARLESDPGTIEEWYAIEDALDDALEYAVKCRTMREKLASKLSKE